MIESYLAIPPLLGFVGLLVALGIYVVVNRFPEGTDEVKKIGDQIHLGAKVIINKTIFKKTILNLSKVLENPFVKSSVRFKANPNKMLINTIPSMLFSINAPKILLGKILRTVPYKLESPDGGT